MESTLPITPSRYSSDPEFRSRIIKATIACRQRKFEDPEEYSKYKESTRVHGKLRYSQDPEVRARKQAYMRQYYIKKKQEAINATDV
jgi:hypothetical protein